MYDKPYLFREIGIGHYPLGLYDVGGESIESLMRLKDKSRKNKLLYIHIPFCESICPFCPYPKFIHDEAVKKEYLDALMKEIELYAQEPHICESAIEAVYFGGGTPSILTEAEIGALFDKLKTRFDMSKVEEITFEGNPASFTKQKLETLKSLGVNRISLGVQTFDDVLAQRIGLIQRAQQSKQVIKWCREAGIDNISIDLMYNLPGQSVESWTLDIAKVVDLGVNHVSFFPLKVIPGFGLFNRIQKGEIPECKDIEFEKLLFTIGVEILESMGYKQESTYDLVQPGKEHIYGRKHFRDFLDLLALGVGAFGEVNGCVYQNTGSIQEYIKKGAQGELPVSKWYQVQEKDLPNRYLAMGFRLLSINRQEFFNQFGQYPEEKFSCLFDKLLSERLVVVSGEEIKLTKGSGVFWGNNICKEFCEDAFKKAFPK